MDGFRKLTAPRFLNAVIALLDIGKGGHEQAWCRRVSSRSWVFIFSPSCTPPINRQGLSCGNPPRRCLNTSPQANQRLVVQDNAR